MLSITRLTESYTDEMVAAIHHGFAPFCRNKRREIFTSDIDASDVSACAIPFDSLQHLKLEGERSPGHV